MSSKRRIAVIGQSKLNANNIANVFKSSSINDIELELYLDYSKLKKFNYSKFKYNDKYVCLLVGPTPHSANYKYNSSSILTELETAEGYPNVIRLEVNNTLKITNSSIKKAIGNIKH